MIYCRKIQARRVKDFQLYNFINLMDIKFLIFMVVKGERECFGLFQMMMKNFGKQCEKKPMISKVDGQNSTNAIFFIHVSSQDCQKNFHTILQILNLKCLQFH